MRTNFACSVIRNSPSVLKAEYFTCIELILLTLAVEILKTLESF